MMIFINAFNVCELQAQPKDADQLHNVLTNRIQKKKLKLSSSEENASDVKSS